MGQILASLLVDTWVAHVATDVRSFVSCLEPKVPREQIWSWMKSFSLCLFFLAGKTREFRVPSLCLHVFPAAALTPSNTLIRLTNSSLGFKWSREKTLKVHPGIWDVVSNGERQKTFVIISRCSALTLVKNKTIRIKGRMLKLGLASLSVPPLSQEFTANKSCNLATLQSILPPSPAAH